MNRSRRARNVSALLLAGTLALGVAGCGAGGGPGTASDVTVPGASAESNAYLNGLYQAAVKSGKTQIVLYGPSVSTSSALYKAFSARYPGITVVAQDGADSTTLTKLEVEAKSGNRVADLYTGGGPSTAVAAAEDNICGPATIKTADAKDLTYQVDDKMLIWAIKYFGLVYNTSMVSDSDVPATWDDLLDPKWKDKIEVYDPTVLGGTRFLFANMLLPDSEAEFGETYLKKLDAQNLAISNNEPNVPADVASGRFPLGIGVFSGYYQTQQVKGAPIGIKFPFTSGNFTTQAGMCLIVDSPHPDATNLYLNWLFTEEGQTAIAEKDGAYGALPESPGPLGAPPVDKLVQLPTLGNDLNAYAPYFATVDSIFKK